jgi:hypothetical protein
MTFPAIFLILVGFLFGGMTTAAICSRAIRRSDRTELTWPNDPALLSDRMCYKDFFSSRADLIKAFSESAKSYIQISSAALALPLVFTQAMLGKVAAEGGLKALGISAPWLLMAWVSFLLAIGFGLLYQWLSVRRLWNQLHKDHLTEQNATNWGFRTTLYVPRLEWLHRSILYGGMVLFFYVGAIMFVMFAIGLVLPGWATSSINL